MPEIVAQVLIVLDDAGEVTVKGTVRQKPISVEQRMLCYGLLEMAKDQITKTLDRIAEDKRIVAPPPGLRITEH